MCLYAFVCVCSWVCMVICVDVRMHALCFCSLEKILTSKGRGCFLGCLSCVCILLLALSVHVYIFFTCICIFTFLNVHTCIYSYVSINTHVHAYSYVVCIHICDCAYIRISCIFVHVRERICGSCLSVLLQHTATHCNTLQRAATQYATLQYSATNFISVGIIHGCCCA